MLGLIVELIGEDAAARLVARFGGTRLYVPHLPAGDDVLAQLVGIDAALTLAHMFGGERIELPKPPQRRPRRGRAAAGARDRAPAATDTDARWRINPRGRDDIWRLPGRWRRAASCRDA